VKREITGKEQVFWFQYADALLAKGFGGKSVKRHVRHAQDLNHFLWPLLNRAALYFPLENYASRLREELPERG